MKIKSTYVQVAALLIFFAMMQAVATPSLMAQSKKVVSGYSHNIALKSNGKLLSWGDNTYGQLGVATAGGSIWYPVTVSGISSVVDVATGYQHSLAVNDNGTVWAWGYNYDGELGNGTGILQTAPIEVPGLSGIDNVSAGYYHSFAVKNNGTLWAWGKNDQGQLGIGTKFNSLIAVKVDGITTVKDVAGGESHSVALKNDGTVWTWGYNGTGELGNGTTNQFPQLTPIQVGGGFSNVTAISVGRCHSLALKADGTLWAWGRNLNGQVGNGNANSQTSPIQVLTNVVAIAAGDYHSLAIKNDGTIWAWGNNAEGQFGNFTTSTIPQTIPIQIGSLNTWSSVSAGSHSTGVMSDGSVWAWGNNTSGQLGNGLRINANLPVSVLFTFATQVARPSFSPEGGADIFSSLKIKITCSTSGAIIHYTTDGSDPSESDPVIASGSKKKLGAGITVLKARAFKNGLAVSEVKAAVYQLGEKVSCGYSHSLAIKSDSSLWVWGNNSNGQLANSAVGNDVLLPNKLSIISGLKDAAGGYQHSVAVKNNGTVWTWGYNGEGELGDGTIIQRTSPVQVAALNSVTNVAAGYYHTMAIKNDGTLWSWGKNNYGQLGNNTLFNSVTPVQVSGLSGVIDVCPGEEFTVALKSDGTVWSWGRGIEGQLGDGTVSQKIVPVRVSCGVNAVAIAAGRQHALLLRSDGTVWAWGQNTYGQVGNGIFTPSGGSPQFIPAQVINLSNVIAIAAGEYHSMAIKNDGTIWAWGYNIEGQAGNEINSNSPLPVQVAGLGGATAIAAGTHNLAITPLEESSVYWSWGNNTHGQIGDSTLTNRNYRVLVHFPVDENGNDIPDWEDYLILNDPPTTDDDQDGLPTWMEMLVYATDPYNFDCNSDGLADGVNVFTGLNPLNSDTDEDGISNLEEVANETNPLLADTDNDGVIDGSDPFPTDPTLSELPPIDPNDNIAPSFTIQEPTGLIQIQ
jgi:alpha-tubulin suppressor-like RCC1 family protein